MLHYQNTTTSHQAINMLNMDELIVFVNELIMPRSFHVKPTQVMFVSGLGRIDYVQVIIFSCTFKI